MRGLLSRQSMMYVPEYGYSNPYENLETIKATLNLFFIEPNIDCMWLSESFHVNDIYKIIEKLGHKVIKFNKDLVISTGEQSSLTITNDCEKYQNKSDYITLSVEY